MSWSEASPLAEVKILDLCRVVSGRLPQCSSATLGADVVKIEEPACGAESRSDGPPFLGGESAYFLSVNRNKRSCAIDTKPEAGKELILRLASARRDQIGDNQAGAVSRAGNQRDLVLQPFRHDATHP
jgi:crotonobetainyl-CoA:carnitine CoA-transferase CaiB-like acyl-CoA transferase